MKKVFINPEIILVNLSSVEAVMDSLLTEKDSNGDVSVLFEDGDREEAEKLSYWSGK